jgi:DNA-binding LacI/PurR family transcriptional regulator
MKKKANIYDVAELAGVSHQTVSRVLNNHPSLKPQTREKVEKAIAKLSYRPNQAARQLVTSKSRMIGLLIANSELFGPAAILTEMEREARLADYSIISIPVLPESKESWVEGIEHLRKLEIDGVITIALPREMMQTIEKRLSGAVIVVVDTEPDKNFDVFNIDNKLGGELATEHLISLGHKEIMHITGPAKSYEAGQRKAGYELAMKRANLKTQIEVGDWSVSTGYKIGRKILEKKQRPTAIFCANDHLSLGLIKAFSQNNLDVPRDLSVVGFDDLPESPYFLPSLTTVRQDFSELGKYAMSKMLQQLKEQNEKSTLMVKPELIVRNSTAKPKGKKS